MEDLQKVNKLQSFSRVSLLLLMGILLALIFRPFYTPILIAAFFALGLEPILRKISTRAKQKKYFVFGLFLIVSVFFVLPGVLLVFRVIRMLKGMSIQSIQESQFFRSLFELWGVFQSYGLHLAETFDLGDGLIPSKEELFATFSPMVIEHTKAILAAMPTYALSIFVFFSFLILFTSRGVAIKLSLSRFNFLPVEEIDNVTQLLKSSCYTILTSILFIGALQALIVALGSLAFGYHEFILIFVVTFLLSFIPVVGAAPVALLLALISLIDGSVGSAIGMAVVAGFAGTIDNVLKPYLFSGGTKNLHPLVSLFGLIGAIMVFGLPGLLLGPLIMQISLELGPAMLKRLLNEAVLIK